MSNSAPCEELGDVDGRGLHLDVDGWRGRCPRAALRMPPAARRSIQKTVLGSLDFQQELEVGGDLGGALAQAGRLVHALQAVEFAFEALTALHGAGVGVAALFEELGAAVEDDAAGSGRAAVAGTGAGRRKTCGRARACVAVALTRSPRCEAALARSMVSVSRASSSKREAESPMPKYWLATSSSSCASSKITAAASGSTPASTRFAGLQLDAEVGEEEVVIDDDELGLERLAAHAGDEAALPVGAGLAEAGFAAGVQLGPERGGLGQCVDLGAVAGFGGLLPRGDRVELVDLFEAGEDGRVAQRVELVPAEIVGAAFHGQTFSGPRTVSRKGTSLKKSCSCRFLVPVEMMTRWPVSRARRRAGSR